MDIKLEAVSFQCVPIAATCGRRFLAVEPSATKNHLTAKFTSSASDAGLVYTRLFATRARHRIVVPAGSSFRRVFARQVVVVGEQSIQR